MAVNVLMMPKLRRVFCRVDPQIIKVIFDNNFEMQLNSPELAAWKSSELSVGCFLDNKMLKIVKGLPQQAEVAQGVPGKLRPRIFSTFGTTRVVGRQSYSPAAFTPRRNP